MVDIYEPQRRILLFGNGAQAVIMRERRGLVEDDGVPVVEFMLMPTREMKDYYDLKEKHFNSHGYIARRYAEALVVNLNDDPLMGTTMVLSDFNWNDTPLSRKFTDKEAIVQLQSQNRNLKRQVAQLREELHLATVHAKEHARNFVELVQTHRRAGGDIIKEDQQLPDEGYNDPT